MSPGSSLAVNGDAPLVRLWTAVLFGYLVLGATLQELPHYVAGRFHAGPFAIGVTVGIAFAGTAVARPLAGRAGDAGRSRSTATAGALLTAVAAAGHLLAPDLGLLLAARLLMGAGEAALFSGTLPWVLAGVRPSRAGRVAGWFGLASYGYGTLTALLVLFLSSTGSGAGQGFGLAVFSASFLVTRAAGSPLVDRYGGLPVARVVLLAESAGLAMLATAGGGPFALCAVAVAGVGLGLIYPAATTLTLRRASAAAAGAAVGAMTSFWDIGILVAGPLAGFIAANGGFRVAFWVAAAMPLLALAVTSTAARPCSTLMEEAPGAAPALAGTRHASGGGAAALPR
jgi:MFS family permease